MTKFTKNLQREKRIRASPEVLLYMYDPAQKKLDEEKSKHASLPEENGFDSA
jgi:hypothetical protein